MDLMKILGEHYPNVQAYCKTTPVTYDQIVWVGGDPLPSQADLESLHVTQHKTAKIKELSDACGAEIIAGFASSALGAPHHYDSEPIDQLNLAGSFIKTLPDEHQPDGSLNTTLHAARPIIDGVLQLKEYKSHSFWQMKQVISDGVAFKLAKLQRYNAMRNTILTNATWTAEQIDAITWQTEL